MTDLKSKILQGRGSKKVEMVLRGGKIFDLITPFNLNAEIEDKNNTAAGVIVAGIMIAVGLIVAAAIL